MSLIDAGAICGGFARNYDAKVREQTSPVVERINSATGVRREPIEVELEAFDGKVRRVMLDCGIWIDPDIDLFTTPNPDVLGVRCGATYFVDSRSEAEPFLFSEHAYLSRTISDADARRMYMAFANRVVCLDSKRILWQSEAVGIEAIYRLELVSGLLVGDGDGLANEDVAFEIDPDTGTILKGGLSNLPGYSL